MSHPLTYGSVCSGIEAATVAWHPLGWRPAFFAEIDKFPSAVLAHHYQHVPNLGDFTAIREADVEPIDLLVGGTPCQSFSVAGKRLGLDDPRGNLALEFLALARRLRPRWLVFENVPGLLSSDGGRDFGIFLGLLGECGYGFAYRILDAQYVRVDGYPRAVPQRRRRVFVVGYLGDWRPPAAVLLEPEGLRGDSAPRREAGQGAAPTIAARTRGGGGLGTDFDCDGGLIPANALDGVSHAVTARHSATGRYDPNGETYIAHALRADGFDASEDGTGRGTPIIPIQSVQAVRDKKQNGIGIGEPGDEMFTLTGRDQHAIAFDCKERSSVASSPVRQSSAVRRLTPIECARLQGFPDDYLMQVIWRGKCPPPDGPQYKALGNSFAVNVVRWIGARIDVFERVARPHLKTGAAA